MKELKLWLRLRVLNEILALGLSVVALGLVIWFLFSYMPAWMVTF